MCQETSLTYESFCLIVLGERIVCKKNYSEPYGCRILKMKIMTKFLKNFEELLNCFTLKILSVTLKMLESYEPPC